MILFLQIEELCQAGADRIPIGVGMRCQDNLTGFQQFFIDQMEIRVVQHGLFFGEYKSREYLNLNGIFAAQNKLPMKGNRTFTMIKPSAFKSGYSGRILAMIEGAGYKILAIKLVHLTRHQAGRFYEMHEGKPFYSSLVDFMSSGPIIAAILEHENAVESFRTFIGATDPAKAEKGTIRNLFGKDLSENAIHGSDSDESAKREGDFFFSFLEQQA
jgi:nucleoside-diphosphate kinase